MINLKSIVFLLAISLTTQSFAAGGIDPDFICVEESGFTYEMYMSHFNEIHVFDENGVNVYDIDGIQFNVMNLESLPPQTRYSVKYADGGTEIANFTFVGDEAIGQGEFVDNDQTMVCLR